jgi:hypothetical protein
MKLIYSPFINKEAVLQRIEDDLDGNVTLQGSIGTKPAQLVLTVKEAARIFRHLREVNIEGLEKIDV